MRQAYATEREGDATLEAERALKRDYDIIIGWWRWHT